MNRRGDAAGGRGAERRLPAVPGRADGMGCVAAGPSSVQGYTLIEVIVAFAVLALGLTLLLGTLSGAARQVRWADEAGRAALHAQSLLAQQGLGEALRAGHREGEFEGGHYRWSLDVAPYRDPARPPPALLDPGAPQLMQWSLAVRWGGGEDDDPRRRLLLQGLRLVAPTADEGMPAP